MAIPIYNAIEVVRAAVFTALDALTAVGVYWQLADEGVEPPFVVFQAQDQGGRAEKHLGAYGWSGLITVRAIAPSQGAAETLMAAVAPGMANLTSGGYGLMAEYMQPVIVPVDADGRWTSGSIWRVYLEAA